jgi:hypothetical protein
MKLTVQALSLSLLLALTAGQAVAQATEGANAAPTDRPTPKAAASGIQSHLAVDIKDPVYPLLELGELKGALSRVSAVRPFSRSEILRLLERMWEHRELFNPREQEILEQTRARLGSSPSGWRAGSLRTGREGLNVQAGADFRSGLRVNADAPEAWNLDSSTRAYLRGDLARWLSYSGSFGFTLDRVGFDSTPPDNIPRTFRYLAYAPYSFSKEWDAYHIGFGEPRTTREGNLAYPTVSYDLGTDIGAQFLNDRVTLRFARFRREWGLGDGSLTLSGTARPFLGGELHARLAPWIAIHHVTGGLSDWKQEPVTQIDPPALGDISYQKLYTLQRLELFPWPWLYASASASVVGARRPEPGYMAPLIFATIWQNTIGDLDNVGVGVDLAGTLPRWGRLYLSFYADEMEFTSLKEMFSRPRNMFALQAGIKVPIPGLPFTALTFQYTRIEPFTYTHSPIWYPDFRLPVDTSYTHDGENLAYALYPNSDEFLVKLRSVPLPRLQASLEYRFIRHGDNQGDPTTDMKIYGRPEAYIDYSLGFDNYPNKYFLHDGLYDYNSIVTLSCTYTLPWFAATVGLSYSFSYTWFDANATTLIAPPVQVRNILALSLTVFR